MTIKTVDVQDAQHQLSDLLAQVAAGTEIILTEDHQPRARLVPIAPPIPRRVPGLHAGSMITTPDFDAPLPDDFWTGAA
jgi:prevent-host-death family protein